MNLGVVLVDDEPLIRSGLRAIINAEPDLDVLGEADDGAGITAMVRRLRPDVVLMDVRMPVVDGIEATRRLLAAGDSLLFPAAIRELAARHAPATPPASGLDSAA